MNRSPAQPPLSSTSNWRPHRAPPTLNSVTVYPELAPPTLFPTLARSVTLPGLIHQTQRRPPCPGTKSVSKLPEDGRRTRRLDTLEGRVPVRLPEAAPHTGGLAPAGWLLGGALLPTPWGFSAGASVQDLPSGQGACTLPSHTGLGGCRRLLGP